MRPAPLLMLSLWRERSALRGETAVPAGLHLDEHLRREDGRAA